MKVYIPINGTHIGKIAQYSGVSGLLSRGRDCPRPVPVEPRMGS
jgi:hypothetical protein